jgi:hypothetical protein
LASPSPRLRRRAGPSDCHADRDRDPCRDRHGGIGRSPSQRNRDGHRDCDGARAGLRPRQRLAAGRTNVPPPAQRPPGRRRGHGPAPAAARTPRRRRPGAPGPTVTRHTAPTGKPSLSHSGPAGAARPEGRIRVIGGQGTAGAGWAPDPAAGDAGGARGRRPGAGGPGLPVGSGRGRH